MNILEKIAANKAREVELRKKVISRPLLENTQLFRRPTFSLVDSLVTSESGIIAEHKRRSPSRPNINQSLPAADVVVGYANAGASGISVLTDTTYFGGCIDDILIARAAVSTPILRKEFILDEYQIVESKSTGADAILLLACMLKPFEIKNLSVLAMSLGMEILLEVRSKEEFERSICPEISLVGVNNRNLKDFQVDVNLSHELAEHIPSEFVKVSESGLDSAKTVNELRTSGYQGFLMGEHFMKHDNPGSALRDFINELKTLSMKLKVCGMKDPENIKQVASLLPDFMGFIFWEKIASFFDGELPDLPQTIQKIGVFVDASEAEIRQKIGKYDLDLIQLHGNESAEFCAKCKVQGAMLKDSERVEIIKAFSISEDFDFGILADYEAVCDYFLFDTKGKNPGGNGEVFDWSLLENYVGQKPIFLSGGIGIDSSQAEKLDFPIFAIDINSKFEIKPGLKNTTKIVQFKNDLK